MGADFVYATVPRFELNPARIQQLYNLINSFSEEELKEGLYHSLDEGAETNWAEVVTAIYEAVKASQKENRTTAWLCLPGMNYWSLITGGFSWGDPPTEAYESMCIIRDYPKLQEAMLAMAREDYAKEHANE